MKCAVLPFAMLVAVMLGVSVSARADTTTVLPITGLSAIVVDDAHQQVFLTGDASDGVVLVTDTTGHVTKTFSGEAGAAGMVLSGGTLYVARCGTTSIDMIDAASLTKSGSIAVSQTIGTPCDLAKAGGRLWFDSSDHLASVTLDAAHTVTDFADATGGVLSTASGAPRLLLANRGSFEYGSPFNLYDVAGPAPQLLSSKGTMTVAELMPDGASALTARLNQEGLYEGPTPEDLSRRVSVRLQSPWLPGRRCDRNRCGWGALRRLYCDRVRPDAVAVAVRSRRRVPAGAIRAADRT